MDGTPHLDGKKFRAAYLAARRRLAVNQPAEPPPNPYKTLDHSSYAGFEKALEEYERAGGGWPVIRHARGKS